MSEGSITVRVELAANTVHDRSAPPDAGSGLLNFELPRTATLADLCARFYRDVLWQPGQGTEDILGTEADVVRCANQRSFFAPPSMDHSVSTGLLPTTRTPKQSERQMR